MILKTLKKLPLIGPALDKWHQSRQFEKRKSNFTSSTDFWRQKYEEGGHSGYGSYNELALFKARVLNEYVGENDYKSYVEFGCGDGNQLKLIGYPTFKGYDISEVSIAKCKAEFGTDSTKSFHLMNEYDGKQFDVGLSLDVIFHLVEDEVYFKYMDDLFENAQQAVVVYASNTNDNSDNYYPQVRHRKFTDDVEKRYPSFKLERMLPNEFPFKGNSKTGSFADFYFFKRQ